MSMKIATDGTDFDDIPAAGRCDAGSVLLAWEKGVDLPRACRPVEGEWLDAAGLPPLRHGVQRWLIIEPTRPPAKSRHRSRPTTACRRPRCGRSLPERGAAGWRPCQSPRSPSR